ncbi:hypothetical protein JBKA6_1441 [Ichthyobacterium seriolicida]|uniref:Uncharacterized protein n=1 Tax=Ichthyobacterium seriolicida TaxID=242600 RepID=A0A1J1E7Z0_9FLAO|nr:hypothetical protein JBKA6_1441 [Ichthyobacterium seriolicida]
MGLTIKIWGKKNGEFSGTCASQNITFSEDGKTCKMCGREKQTLTDCNNK